MKEQRMKIVKDIIDAVEQKAIIDVGVGYDNEIETKIHNPSEVADSIEKLLAEYEKQVRVDELELLDIIAFRDETYKQANSTQIVLYGHILNRIKELKEKL